MIGTVLHFDERSYYDSIGVHERICRAIDIVAETYQALDSTFEFNQEVLQDMLINKSANIHRKYEATINEQIKTSKITSKAIIDSMKRNVVADIQGLEDKIDRLLTAIQNVYNSQNPFTTIHFDISNISIIDGKATVTEQGKAAIKDLCETKIRTEDQNTFYNLSLKMKETFENIVSFLKEKNPKLLQRSLVANNGGLFVEERGGLIINNCLITKV